MLTVPRADISGQLQPRHAYRRQRQPGARERHSFLKHRLCSVKTSSVPFSPRQKTSNLHASFCMTSASHSNRQPITENVVEPDHVISAMKDLSTIEAIRESMKATEKKQTSNINKQIPNWMLELDMNLDVTAVDIIPPFDETANSDDVTYNEQPTVTYVYDEDNDIDLYGEYPELFSKEIELHKEPRPVSESIQKAETTRTVTISTSDLEKLRSPSPGGRQSRASTPSRSSPRRYQGDKKVLSMQQGGIRSTPMQPTSTKFINQMITYTHVKVHDKKLKRAKPAIDTKMPTTFKIALDRKKLVEEKFNRSFESSTPRRRPSIKSEPLKQSKGEKAR